MKNQPKKPKKIDQSAEVLGTSFFSRHKSDLLAWLRETLQSRTEPLIIFTPNPEHLMIAREQPSFQNTLNQADVRVADGIGIVWASRLLSQRGHSEPIAERITGVELVTDLLQLAIEQNWTVAIIGGRGYDGRSVTLANGQTLTISKYQTDSPQAQLYWLEAYQDVRQATVKEEIMLKEQLTTLKPDLVLVALGAPHQEEWILQHYETLRDNSTKIAMVVGGAFDMLTGQTQRAPLLYRKAGFEWLYRLWQQPWRWKRQLRLVRYIGAVINSLF